MITLLTGAPGHGKSYTAVRLIEESVAKGIPVATNVALRPDWPQVIARRRTLFGRWRPERVAERAREYARLVHCTDDRDELFRVRFAGQGEGRGRIILEEVHRWLNSRLWSAQDRQGWVDHLSAHRHYGADVWLISQSDTNIDAQIRGLYEFHTEVRNFRRLPVVGSIIRVNLFLAVTRWNDKARTKAGLSVYGLSKSIARLYNTHALQDADWPEDAIVLPRSVPPVLVVGDGPEQPASARSALPPAPPPLPPPERTERVAEDVT